MSARNRFRVHRTQTEERGGLAYSSARTFLFPCSKPPTDRTEVERSDPPSPQSPRGSATHTQSPPAPSGSPPGPQRRRLTRSAATTPRASASPPARCRSAGGLSRSSPRRPHQGRIPRTRPAIVILPRVSETNSKQIEKASLKVFYLSDRLIELPRELDAEDEVLAASRADRVMRDLKVPGVAE